MNRRQAVYERLFSARALFIAGLIIMPSLLFNSSTPFRIIQFLFFWLLAWLSGKKNNPLITLLVIVSVVAFNLLVPYGRILLTIGPLKITLGALIAGIHRAVTLEGLIMLSRATVRRDLRFPGLFGRLTGDSFRIFSLLMESRPRISGKNIINDIDNLLIELNESGVDALPPETALISKTTPAGWVIIAVAILLSWLLWAIPLFNN